MAMASGRRKALRKCAPCSSRSQIPDKEKGPAIARGAFLYGGPCWIRTSDQLIKSQLLYQLS